MSSCGLSHRFLKFISNQMECNMESKPNTESNPVSFFLKSNKFTEVLNCEQFAVIGLSF